MSHIELSIAETNKLREQLGLALIPDPYSGVHTETIEINSDTNCKVPISVGGSIPETRSEENVPESKSNPESKSHGPVPEKSPAVPNIISYDDYDTSSWLDSLGSQTIQNIPEKPNSPSIQNPLVRSPELHPDLASSQGEVLHLQDAAVVDDDTDVLINEDQEKRNHGSKKQENSEEKHEPLDKRHQTNDLNNSNLNNSKVDFDILETAPITKPVTFKKPKKPKSSSKKRTREPDLAVHESMVTMALEYDDQVEDELGKALSANLAKKQATRRVKTAEEVANDVSMHQRMDFMEKEMDFMERGMDSNTRGMVYDTTQDFLDSLSVSHEPVPKSESVTRSETIPRSESVSKSDLPDSVPKSDLSDLPNSVPKSDLSQSAASTSAPSSASSPHSTEIPTPHSTENPSVPFSLSATLKQLRQNSPPDNQKQKRLREQKKDAELARIKIKIEERLLAEELAKDKDYARMRPDEKDQVFDRELNARLVSKGIVEKSFSNWTTSNRPNSNRPNSNSAKAKYSQYGTDRLQDYDPQVSIKYHDAKGHTLSVKEAWKELSHRYHGSAPKKDKRR